MTHANAPLTPAGRLRLARCVVDDGWPLRPAAERFQVSVSTAQRWASRYRTHGTAGMIDRSSRPHHSPRRTPRRVERRIINLRVNRRWGPARIAHHLRLNPATVHRILVRHRLPRLSCLDQATATPVRRYERATAGELVHIDIKKLGNIPDGGGHRFTGRRIGLRHRVGMTVQRRPNGNPKIGFSYLHTALDDHSRLAYTEILPDETTQTAIGFFHRAHTFFTAAGITVQRVLTDNGPCYRARLWRHTLATTGVTAKYTRPYRPQTNGKVERFHRTLLTEWAYARTYHSETERRQALQPWLHTYNHHRTHTALDGQPPASRVPNLTSQYT
ncbi:IS481 family transposase [Kibdelosporangium aridum]|uniref:IS481 family transposase n=1 Tax=Kibdelosporangium aridum TaxID=2030 RepID=UPI0035ECE1C0